ncbi:MAG: APC family permease [Candidatus Omnitrophica bacterium]|nr:APC family permease [Candidatus Omnitrophota bacterium]
MSLIKRIKNLVIGKSRDLEDRGIFHKISLIAFFAWIGLGADGLSSSCYGPQEAFLALGTHPYLSIFVAIGTVLTIFVISASYSQIVELFPTGGGGYLVASKLLSPTTGMVSGCALLIDYVLTITVSIAAGADAVFSLLPLPWHVYRLQFALLVVIAMMVLNMRGVKESILFLAPIFIAFLVTHVFIIGYAIFTHLPNLTQVALATKTDIHSSFSELGLWGMIFLVLRAYSMGAGTYTGIEAVSNGIPVLREPKAQTAKHTMRYMAISLAFVVMGLMLGYILFQITPQAGKTLNAILFEEATKFWNKNTALVFVFITLIAEAMLLFVGAQAGFLDGPRVLANMAKDRWFPTRFSTLSDRLVTQNGILIMGGLALFLMLIAHGSVRFLVVLYSINVFITFVLSQLGMVRHWWLYRVQVKRWFRKLLINGIGLLLTASILIFMIIFKFNEGGWITLLITGALVILAMLIRRHYYKTAQILHRLNSLVIAAESNGNGVFPHVLPGIKAPVQPDPKAKTAVLLVSGFNGMGLHTLFGVIRLFGGTFKNFVFVEIGVVDAGNFKGVNEVDRLNQEVHSDIKRYVNFMQKQGFYAEGFSALSVDPVDEAARIAPQIIERFPNAIFFGGQLIFPKDSFVVRFLHNYTVFAMQKRLYREGIPFVILPIRV